MNYFSNLVLAFNQLINAIFGRDHDLTMSSRAYIKECQGKGSWQRKAIDSLFFWQSEHCKNAFRWEYRKNKRFLTTYEDIYKDARK